MDSLSVSHRRVDSWLASGDTALSPLTPPPDDVPKSRQGTLKRKRATSLPSNMPTSHSQRSDSPKRRRTDDEDVGPEQSASQLGSEASLTLNRTNTFSPPASRVSSGLKRSQSPTRETPIILRSAQPPIWTESLNGLKEHPPENVDRLGDYLAKDVDFGFIPQGLQPIIESDPEVGHQKIKPTDFDRGDMRSCEELLPFWEEVKKIFLNARDCKDGSRDENAWCDDVVRPLVHLAMKMCGDNRWCFQNVQSQSINPLYLSTIPSPTLTDPARRKPIDRKTDYVFSYSHRDPAISALYKKLDAASNSDISYTLDAFTKRIALFSSMEVKSASVDHTEAELQMSIGIAASLRKKEELARAARIDLNPTSMVEPALTVVGHEHSVYYAYPRKDLVPGRSGVHVLGPDLDRFERLSTDSIRGVLRTAKVYVNLLKFGMDEEGYWGGFFRPVLNKLAGI